MATSKQEQLYGEILEYYSFADRLVKAVEDSSHQLASQQFAIIEDIANRLEESTDQLTTTYIEFVKNGESEEATEAVRIAINNVSSKIEECRNKILMLYHENSDF
jgi:hypothetical protein